MSEFEFDIGIIGGGAAGLTVAAGSSQLGAKTLLVEKENELGGDCLHYGCVPSKTLINSAHVYHQLKNTRMFGLPPVDVPPVDFKDVSKRIRSVISTIQRHDSVDRFCGLGTKVEFGTPEFTDKHTIRLNGKMMTAKNWVIATGSSPAAPPIPGLDQTGYITNREIFYLDKLPVSLIILGAGPIGVEMSQAFARLGSKVMIVDRADQILIKEDKDMADQVMSVLKSEGVEFYLESSILSVSKHGREKCVELELKDGRNIELKADTILVAMGRSANTQNLGLENIGVKTTRAGIAVDSRLHSTQKHIFAAGDVNGGYQFTHAAGYEGGIVVSNAIFRLPRKVDYTNLPWCTYTHPELASIGMNEKSAAEAGIKCSVWTEHFKDNDRRLAEGEPVGLIKLILNDREKPIGVQILGHRAGDLMAEWVAIMNGNVKLSTLASAIHPYPTIGEINKRVAGAFFTPKIFSDKMKKGLKFFFNLKGRACTLET